MTHSPPFGRFVRYLAIIFGPGLIGWAIALRPAGFAMGIGAGIVVAGIVWRLALAFEEPTHIPIRIVLDTADFACLVRGQWTTRPGGIRIVLADIGFPVMSREIRAAEGEQARAEYDRAERGS